MENRRGIGLISTLLVVTLIAAFLAAVGFVLAQERARVRDARRIVDMTRVQYGFESIFRETGSYAEAASSCGQVGVEVATCNLARYVPTIASVKDPGNGHYRVEKVPDAADYAVSFSLERGYDTLTAGKHVLSKDGIR